MMGSMSLSEEEETRALLGVGGSDKAPSVSQEVAPQDPPAGTWTSGSQPPRL